MDKYVVYCHKTPNNKRYVGITNNIKNRWRNGNGYVTHTYFYNAIRKYGWENIQHIILEENLTFSKAKILEKFYIKKYKTNNKKFGYNLTTGGDACKFNKESKQKMSRQRKGKRLGAKNTHAKKIICLDTLEIFDTIKEAGQKYNINKGDISACCMGKHKIIGNKHWLYYEDYLIKTKDEIEQILRFKGCSKKIICIETGKIYNSIQEASVCTNINNCCIWATCKGRQKTAGGYRWQYLDN